MVAIGRITGKRASESIERNGILEGCSAASLGDVLDGNSTNILIGKATADIDFVQDGNAMDCWYLGSPQIVRRGLTCRWPSPRFEGCRCPIPSPPTRRRAPMKRIAPLYVVFFVLLGSVSATAADPYPKGQWVPLFNGRDLDGWTPKITGYELGENFGNTFRVEGGVLKVAYDQYDNFGGRFGHLFYKDKFSHYKLRVEYRFTGEQIAGGPGWALRNSGLMLHGQSAESMGKDQSFPVSVEVQLLGGSGQGERSTANVCTPGTHIVMDGQLVTRHCISSTSKTYHGDQWVTLLVEMHGNGTCKHILDGETVFTYEKPQLDENDADAKKLIVDGNKMLHEGTISLQSESHPVEFRKVEIMVLDE